MKSLFKKVFLISALSISGIACALSPLVLSSCSSNSIESGSKPKSIPPLENNPSPEKPDETLKPGGDQKPTPKPPVQRPSKNEEQVKLDKLIEKINNSNISFNESLNEDKLKNINTKPGAIFDYLDGLPGINELGRYEKINTETSVDRSSKTISFKIKLISRKDKKVTSETKLFTINYQEEVISPNQLLVDNEVNRIDSISPNEIQMKQEFTVMNKTEFDKITNDSLIFYINFDSLKLNFQDFNYEFVITKKGIDSNEGIIEFNIIVTKNGISKRCSSNYSPEISVVD